MAADRAGRHRALADLIELATLTDIERDRDRLGIVFLAQPWNRDRRIEPAGVGEHYSLRQIETRPPTASPALSRGVRSAKSREWYRLRRAFRLHRRAWPDRWRAPAAGPSRGRCAPQSIAVRTRRRWRTRPSHAAARRQPPERPAARRPAAGKRHPMTA